MQNFRLKPIAYLAFLIMVWCHSPKVIVGKPPLLLALALIVIPPCSSSSPSSTGLIRCFPPLGVFFLGKLREQNNN